MARKSSAVHFAQVYAERKGAPLTEEDLAYAFEMGKRWGRKSQWKLIGNSRELKQYPNEQIAVVVKLGPNEYDIDVISSADFDKYVNNSGRMGKPTKYAHLNTLLFTRQKPPKGIFPGGKISFLDIPQNDDIDIEDNE